MKHLAEETPRWRYTEPPPINTKLMLLTVGGQQVTGPWSGKFGETYLAWSGMLKRDKAKEKELGYTS